MINIFKNTGYQALTRILSSTTGFIITLILARYLGVGGFGDFVKVTTFIGFFYLLADFGLNAIYLQKNGDQNNFSSLFYLRLLFSLILVVLANIIPFLLPFSQGSDFGFPPSLRFGILIFSLSIFVQSIIYSSTALFQKDLRFDRLLFAQILGSFLTLFLVTLFVFLSFSINYIFLAFIFGGLLTAFLALIKSRGTYWPVKLDFRFINLLLKQSWPLGLMLFFNLVYFRVDIFLLSILRSTAEVGIYGFSYKFFDFLIALPLFLANSIYPLILKQEKDLEFRVIISKYLKISLLTSFALVIVFWFLAPLFSLVKSEFKESIFPFRILLLSLPFFFTTAILQWALIAKKKQKFLMAVYLSGAILNIILNLVFIPIYGYVASAFITGISEAFVLGFLTGNYFSLIEKFTNKYRLL